MDSVTTATDYTMDTGVVRPDDWSLKAFLSSSRAQRPAYLVNALLPENSLTMLSAEPYAGKTLFSLALALAVARGEPFLGHSTTRAPVLFIGNDAPGWDYGGVLRKLLTGSPPPETFYILPNLGFQLLDREWRARLGKQIEDHGIKLIILDTLRAAHGKNENDSCEMQAVMNDLRAISVTYGVSILFLHHSSKKNAEGFGSEYRGSSVLLGSCDFFLHMTAVATGPGCKLLTLKCLKGRGGSAPDRFAVRLAWDDNSASLSPVAGCHEDGDPTIGDIINRELDKGPVRVAAAGFWKPEACSVAAPYPVMRGDKVPRKGWGFWLSHSLRGSGKPERSAR